jgi:hypothetical protein
LRSVYGPICTAENHGKRRELAILPEALLNLSADFFAELLRTR